MSEQLSIAEVADRTGLSKDTLRWYENEGLIPQVPRDNQGRRSYDEASLRMIELLVKLRRTGMPVRSMREFLTMVDQGAPSHGHRMTLLTEHRDEVLAKVRETLADLDAIEAKISHYAELIEAGLDCNEQPVTPEIAAQQQRR